MVVYSVLPYDREATQPLERLDLTKARGAKGPRTPLGRVSDEGEGAEEDEAGPERPLVGRSDEMATILARAAGVVDGTGPGGAVVIEGHTGVGRCVWIIQTGVGVGVWMSQGVAKQDPHPHTACRLYPPFPNAHSSCLIPHARPGMGKTKLLAELRRSLEALTVKEEAPDHSGRPAFSLFLGIADTANSHEKLHPWRQVFRELLEADA